MPLYHTSAREHCHDSAPYLLPAGNCWTPVALHHAARRVAKPRRGVTSTTGSPCALQEQAPTRQRTQTLQGVWSKNSNTALWQGLHASPRLISGLHTKHPLPHTQSWLRVEQVEGARRMDWKTSHSIECSG